MGVELYGYQQHLGRLHARLAATQKSSTEVTDIRKTADQQILHLRKESAAETEITNKHRVEVWDTEAVSTGPEKLWFCGNAHPWCAQMEAFREALDDMSNMHKQVEAHSQQQKNELAVTKRCGIFCANQIFMFNQRCIRCWFHVSHGSCKVHDSAGSPMLPMRPCSSLRRTRQSRMLY